VTAPPKASTASVAHAQRLLRAVLAQADRPLPDLAQEFSFANLPNQNQIRDMVNRHRAAPGQAPSAELFAGRFGESHRDHSEGFMSLPPERVTRL